MTPAEKLILWAFVLVLLAGLAVMAWVLRREWRDGGS